MSAKTDVNRRVLAIQAKKKRHKPSKRKNKIEPENSSAQSSKNQGSHRFQDSANQQQYSGGNSNRLCFDIYCTDMDLSFFVSGDASGIWSRDLFFSFDHQF